MSDDQWKKDSGEGQWEPQQSGSEWAQQGSAGEASPGDGWNPPQAPGHPDWNQGWDQGAQSSAGGAMPSAASAEQPFQTDSDPQAGASGTPATGSHDAASAEGQSGGQGWGQPGQAPDWNNQTSGGDWNQQAPAPGQDWNQQAGQGWNQQHSSSAQEWSQQAGAGAWNQQAPSSGQDWNQQPSAPQPWDSQGQQQWGPPPGQPGYGAPAAPGQQWQPQSSAPAPRKPSGPGFGSLFDFTFSKPAVPTALGTLYMIATITIGAVLLIDIISVAVSTYDASYVLLRSLTSAGEALVWLIVIRVLFEGIKALVARSGPVDESGDTESQ